MELNQSNKMVEGAPKEKFHFSGDGVYFPKVIIAATIEEAEKIWHGVKMLIVKSSGVIPTQAPEAIVAPTEQPKVEDKATNI